MVEAALPQDVVDGEYYLALRIHEAEYSGEEWNDQENYIHEVEGDVVLRGFNEEFTLPIGTFTLYLLDGDGLIAQDLSIHDAYDYMGETFGYYEDLVDHNNPWYFQDRVLKALDCEDDTLPSGMLIVSDITIHPQFRGQDFGLRALKCIVQRFRMGMGIVAMRPFPLQYADVSERAKHDLALENYSGSERACLMKLRAHFARLGFRLVPGTDVMAMETISTKPDEPFY